jgi:hypothetical protein
MRISAEAHNAQPRLAALLSAFPPDQSIHKQSSGREEQAYSGWAYGVQVSSDLIRNINNLLDMTEHASDEVINAIDFVYSSFRKATEEAQSCQNAFESKEAAEIVKAYAHASRDLLQASSERLATVIDPVLRAKTVRVQTPDVAVARDQASARVEKTLDR